MVALGFPSRRSREADRLLATCTIRTAIVGGCSLTLSKRDAHLLLVFLCGGWLVLFPANGQNPAANSKETKDLYLRGQEGVQGVVTADHSGPAGFEYERFRHFMTNETLTAIALQRNQDDRGGRQRFAWERRKLADR